MATLKIIPNENCKLFVDQEFICELKENKLHKENIETGVYLIDVISVVECISFDLSVERSDQQFLKRITFNKQEEVTTGDNVDFKNNPDLVFYSGVARVKQNDLYGYIGSDYQWIVKPEFSYAEHFFNSIAIAEKKFNNIKKICVLDTKGHNILGGWFDVILHMNQNHIVLKRDNQIVIYDLNTYQINHIYELSGNIIENEPIPVTKQKEHLVSNPKAGFINIKGEEVLPFIYEKVSNFSESGYALVQKYGIERFINREGKVCILNSLQEIDNKITFLDDEYDWCGKLESSAPDSLFLSGCIRLSVCKNGKWGYCYLREDSSGMEHLFEMIPCEYDLPLSDSKYGYVVMKKGSNVCIVNLVNATYRNGEKKGQYVYGKLGEILFSIEGDELYPINICSSEWIDIAGHGGLMYKYDFNNLVLRRNGKYGIVNKKGSFITQCVFDNIYTKHKNSTISHDFIEDVCIAENEGSKELITSQGKIISNVNASDIFKVGHFWAVSPKGTNKYYLFSEKQSSLIQGPFDDIEYGNYKEEIQLQGIYRSGYDDYFICNNGSYGVINRFGALTVECVFSKITRIDDIGYVVVYKGKHGVISYSGSQILPCNFDQINYVFDYNDNSIIYLPVINNKVGCYSSDGLKIHDCIYDEIKRTSIDCCDLILKQNGKYALHNVYNSIISDFIYDEIIYSDIIFNNDDDDDNEEEPRITYIVRNGNQYGVIDNKGCILVECKYHYLRLCSTRTPSMKLRYEVGIDNFHGILIEGGIFETGLKYESISDLSIYSNRIEIYVIGKNGKKALMSFSTKEILTDFIYDEINIHHDADYMLTGYSVKKNGLWGFINNKYIQSINCLYSYILPIEYKSSNCQKFVFKVSNEHKKYGVVNEDGLIIVPITYDKILQITIKNRVFLCLTNLVGKKNFNDICEPFLALDLSNNIFHNLKCTDFHFLRKELSSIVSNN